MHTDLLADVTSSDWSVSEYAAQKHFLIRV